MLEETSKQTYQRRPMAWSLTVLDTEDNEESARPVLESAQTAQQHAWASCLPYAAGTVTSFRSSKFRFARSSEALTSDRFSPSGISKS